MQEKFSPKDQAVRAALWKAHNKTDFYSGTLIEYREMVIDHILPKDLFKDEERLNKLLEELGLQKDFKMDHILNYAPTRRDKNNEKGKSINKGVIFSALEKARQKESEVMKLISKIREEENVILLAEKISLIQDIEIKELAADIILNDIREFGEARVINEEVYSRSTKRVSLSAFLYDENSKDSRPSCLFEFRTIKIRDAKITLDNKEIIEVLYPRRNTPYHMKLRHFIVGELNDNYCIQLGNSRFFLTREETEELCILIDDFLNVYIESLIRFENHYAIRNLKLTSCGNIKLVKISKKFCEKIIEFANNTKLEDEWNVFEPNSSLLKIYTYKHLAYKDGYHAIIEVTREDEYSEWNFEEYVWLTLAPYYQEKDTEYWWTPLEVKAWLVTQLFPKVIYESTAKRNWLNKPTKNYDEFCKGLKINKLYYEETLDLIDVNQITAESELYDLIYKLQNFYCIGRNEYYFENGIKEIYLILLMLLKSGHIQHIGYIVSKLHFTDAENEESLIDDLKKYLKEYKEQVISAMDIDHALRCILEVLRNGNCVVSFPLVKSIVNSFAPIIYEYNIHKRLEQHRVLI